MKHLSWRKAKPRSQRCVTVRGWTVYTNIFDEQGVLGNDTPANCIFVLALSSERLPPGGKPNAQLA